MFKLRMRLLVISMSLATSAAFASVPFVAPVVQAAPAQVADQSPFSFDVPCFPNLPALPALPCYSECVTPVATETPTPAATLIPRVQSTPTPAATLTPRVQSTPTPTPMPTATPTPMPTATPTPMPTATPTPKCECSTPTSYDNGASDNSDVFNQMQSVFDGYSN